MPTITLKGILNRFYSLNRKDCKIMEGLKFKGIAVVYGPAIIQGVERAPVTKLWTVAVSTVEPDETCNNHASWMTEIQFAHADTSLRIGELEHKQILMGIKSYASGVKLQVPKPVKNN